MKILPFAATCIDLEDSCKVEINQTERDKSCRISKYVEFRKQNETNSRLMDTDTRLVVARGERACWRPHG